MGERKLPRPRFVCGVKLVMEQLGCQEHDGIRLCLTGFLHRQVFDVLDLRREGLLGYRASVIVAEGRRDSLHAEALQILKSETARSLQWLAELADLDAAFSSTEYDVLVLKGGALLHHGYRDMPGARFLSDLDLMVRAEQRLGAVSVLEAIDYRSVNGIEFYHEARPLVLDLHVHPVERVSSAFTFSIQELWERSLPLDEGRYRHLRRLSREDHYLHLAVHALKHGYERLSWLVDLAVIAGDFDADLLLERAERSQSLRVLSYTFFLLESVLQVPLPAFWSRLPPLNAIERAYLGKVASRDCPRTLGKLVILFSIEGWRERTRYLYEVCAPQSMGQAWNERLRALANMGIEVLRTLKPKSKAQSQE